MEPVSDTEIKKIKPQSPYYFETADLVIIALFAALGGISSSVLANIIRAVFRPLQIPGFGQIFAGLHIIWFVLIYLWVNKKAGAVILAGLIKGMVELFSGNDLVFLSFILAVGGAITFEVSIYILSNLFRDKRLQHVSIAVSAGLAAVSNLIIQIETFIGYNHPPEINILFLGVVFILGCILGGYLGMAIFKVFEQTSVLDWRRTNN